MIGMFLRINKNELEEYINDSSLFENRIDAEENFEEPSSCDIDKSWDALSFLITGVGPTELDKARPPLTWTIFGAYILDENQDLGYGPANYLTPEQVKELNNALKKLSDLDLQKNYDFEKMNNLDIYPNFWTDQRDEMTYLLQHFSKLKDFYATAAINDQAVISYLS